MKAWTADLPAMPNPKALAALVAGAFLFLLLLFPATTSLPVHAMQGHTMGTTWSLQLALPTSESPDPVLAGAIAARLEHLDRAIFSTWTPDSELMQLNVAIPGVARAVSVELGQVLALASSIHALSEGAFDPTVGPLVRLWGFGVDQTGDNMPSDTDIALAQEQTGMDALVLDGNSGTATPGRNIELDLSGIAKGYAVDDLARLLEGFGYDNYIFEVGGELRVSGAGPDGDGWTLAMEKPGQGERSAMAAISSEGQTFALAASGDYRNFRIMDGQRYSHEIDPVTGRPVTHNLAAVTVLASQAAIADAWATALMVLGPEKGLLLAEKNSVAAYFIMHEGDGFRTRASTDMQARYPDL